jgi:hypothetical protein
VDTREIDHGAERRAIDLADPLDVVTTLPAGSIAPPLELASPTVPESPRDDATPFDSAVAGTEFSPRLLPVVTGRELRPDAARVAPNRAGTLGTAPSAVIQATAVEGKDIVALMRSLHDAGSAAAAEQRLIGLGFATNHIELARQFTSPNPDERVRAVRSLPSIRGIVARDWFRWASRDDAASVRLAALSLMVTSGQPELLALVEELATSDVDREVRETALTALERLRQKRR